MQGILSFTVTYDPTQNAAYFKHQPSQQLQRRTQYGPPRQDGSAFGEMQLISFPSKCDPSVPTALQTQAPSSDHQGQEQTSCQCQCASKLTQLCFQQMADWNSSLWEDRIVGRLQGLWKSAELQHLQEYVEFLKTQLADAKSAVQEQKLHQVETDHKMDRHRVQLEKELEEQRLAIGQLQALHNGIQALKKTLEEEHQAKYVPEQWLDDTHKREKLICQQLAQLQEHCLSVEQQVQKMEQLLLENSHLIEVPAIAKQPHTGVKDVVESIPIMETSPVTCAPSPGTPSAVPSSAAQHESSEAAANPVPGRPQEPQTGLWNNVHITHMEAVPTDHRVQPGKPVHRRSHAHVADARAQAEQQRSRPPATQAIESNSASMKSADSPGSTNSLPSQTSVVAIPVVLTTPGVDALLPATAPSRRVCFHSPTSSSSLPSTTYITTSTLSSSSSEGSSTDSCTSYSPSTSMDTSSSLSSGTLTSAGTTYILTSSSDTAASSTPNDVTSCASLGTTTSTSSDSALLSSGSSLTTTSSSEVSSSASTTSVSVTRLNTTSSNGSGSGSTTSDRTSTSVTRTSSSHTLSTSGTTSGSSTRASGSSKTSRNTTSMVSNLPGSSVVLSSPTTSPVIPRLPLKSVLPVDGGPSNVTVSAKDSCTSTYLSKSGSCSNESISDSDSSGSSTDSSDSESSEDTSETDASSESSSSAIHRSDSSEASESSDEESESTTVTSSSSSSATTKTTAPPRTASASTATCTAITSCSHTYSSLTSGSSEMTRSHVEPAGDSSVSSDKASANAEQQPQPDPHGEDVWDKLAPPKLSKSSQSRIPSTNASPSSPANSSSHDSSSQRATKRSSDKGTPTRRTMQALSQMFRAAAGHKSQTAASPGTT